MLSMHIAKYTLSVKEKKMTLGISNWDFQISAAMNCK
jgi:hypothetical protein